MTAGVATIVGLNVQREITPDVTLRTSGHLARRRHLMRIRKWESGGAVIKFSRVPGHGVVASRALRRWEIGGDMVRNVATERLRFVPIRLMARQAVRGIQGVIVIYVTGQAWRRCRRHVRANEREAGCTVIERRRGPRNRVVTSGAVGCSERCAGTGVCGIVGLLPGR